MRVGLTILVLIIIYTVMWYFNPYIDVIKISNKHQIILWYNWKNVREYVVLYQ